MGFLLSDSMSTYLSVERLECKYTFLIQIKLYKERTLLMIYIGCFTVKLTVGRNKWDFMQQSYNFSTYSLQ